MNKITICDKEYEISCNAFTRFEYKKIFGVGIFEDIQKLNTFTQEQESLRKKLQVEGLEEAEILEIIESGTPEQLREASLFYLYTSGFYRRFLIYYATLLKYTGIYSKPSLDAIFCSGVAFKWSSFTELSFIEPIAFTVSAKVAVV